MVRNSRREVTLYFLSDEDEDVAVLVVEVLLELSEEELLPLLTESVDELELSFLSDFSEPLFSAEPLEEPSPSFLPLPLPGLLLPPLA